MNWGCYWGCFGDVLVTDLGMGGGYSGGDTIRSEYIRICPKVCTHVYVK